jgi:hypothetical protein
MPRSKQELKPISASKQDELDLEGTWVNQLGSKMEIDSVKVGLIKGRYWSEVSKGQNLLCGVLSGTVAGDNISFTVNWLTENAVTSWSGKLLVSIVGNKILTRWEHLYVDSGGKVKKRCGRDTFVQMIAR